MAVISVKAEAENSTVTYIDAGGHRVIIDEPPAFGGEDTAPSPVAMLLASVAGCINAIGQWTAKEMGFTIEKLDIQVDGDVDATAFFTGDMSKRAGFSSINVNISLKADITDEQRKIWLENVSKRCPVTDNIMYPTPVNFKAEP